MSQPKWLDLAKREIGTKEVAGKADNPAVMAYYADAGFPDIEHDETAWCAAFVNSMLKRSGLVGTRSLAARSFERYGKALDKPQLGCIAVFPRGKGWQGHVGFVAEVGEKTVKLLGGNQGDAVGLASYPIDKAIAWRWPVRAEPKRPVPEAPTTVPDLIKVSRKASTLKRLSNALHAIWISLGVGTVSEWTGYATEVKNDVAQFCTDNAKVLVLTGVVVAVLVVRHVVRLMAQDVSEGRYIPSGSQ